MIMAFRTWMLTEGYAVGTINVRLASVRTYARLAQLAGVLSADSISRTRQISGYRGSEGARSIRRARPPPRRRVPQR
jgi:hypothetical protein